jgi:hypothetical protein
MNTKLDALVFEREMELSNVPAQYEYKRTNLRPLRFGKRGELRPLRFGKK